MSKRLSTEKLKKMIESWGGVPALAIELHVTRQAVYTWLRGDRCPPLDRILKIASILGCELDDLLEEDYGDDSNP